MCPWSTWGEGRSWTASVKREISQATHSHHEDRPGLADGQEEHVESQVLGADNGAEENRALSRFVRPIKHGHTCPRMSRTLWDPKFLLHPREAPLPPPAPTAEPQGPREAQQVEGKCVCARGCCKNILGLNSLVQCFSSKTPIGWIDLGHASPPFARKFRWRNSIAPGTTIDETFPHLSPQ